jgi:hypothetical protein
VFANPKLHKLKGLLVSNPHPGFNHTGSMATFIQPLDRRMVARENPKTTNSTLNTAIQALMDATAANRPIGLPVRGYHGRVP